MRSRYRVALLGILLLAAAPIFAQTIAVFAPDELQTSKKVAEKLTGHLTKKLSVLDESLALAAFSSSRPAAPFNMTDEESKRVGAVVGCDLFVMVRADTLRRSSSARTEYYESFASIYVVSRRTGGLVYWLLPRFDAGKPGEAERMLDASIPSLADNIVQAIRAFEKKELAAPPASAMEEPPEENSPAAKSFRAPIPYRRIKPEYTLEASMFDVAATVDIVIDLSATGAIMRTRIVRWAGFGLDESVESAVRSMNWRPAMRDGKPLPMRFLVRYNFKKIPKENADPDK